MSRLDKGLVLIFVLGVAVSSVSLFRGILVGSQVQVEYLENNKGNQDLSSGESLVEGIVVDIEGAVISPGVYTLPINARIKDLLVVAGGFAATADRIYCEKNLNLAQLLKDGQKIYIPMDSNTPTQPGYLEAKNGPKIINVNTATLSELDTLQGVGPARSETIVKNRPYGNLEELVSKGGMTKQIFEKNKDLIGLY